ncbi:MAG: helicase-exonuclease AddAB subunit AddA [Lachnospiraceae bacterium]|nr:helicase-exonuclease AddAB subunit AddA [Lachnospiraceae bacterium]
MGEIRWTSDQQAVIDMREANILVSAAAGSGKTAVLVERIFSRIMDESHPVDVDRFVIVTFTKAAAAQMKERLRSRLEEALLQNPENRHLQRQAGLIASAHISTVHSFCGYVIQNYFHRIGLDPAYRQGTESELALLQNETLEEILEEEYTEQRPDFVELAGMAMFHRSDARMLEMILELYNRAMSEPFPDDWLTRMEEFLSVPDKSQWEDSPFVKLLMEDCRRMVEGLLGEAQRLMEVARSPGGPYYFEKQLEALMELCQGLLEAEGYEAFREVLDEMSFARMMPKRDDSVETALKEAVQEGRKRCKETLEEMREGYFFQDIEGHLADLEAMGGKLVTLLRLTRRFKEEYTEAKRERGLVDFNDLEQLALSILLEWDDEKQEYVRSAAALELAEQFEEIMIDEYQDSNRVQDTLLMSVSRDGLEGFAPNVFMVGDVKQSIYRFRNACPELFAEKLLSYDAAEGSSCRRIDLHQNFRSREVVLEGSNSVFARVMHRDLGGVEYDEAARLRCRREFPDTDKRAAETIDAYVILDKEDAELEGRLIASKIQELTNPQNPLYLFEEEGWRPASYRDIVVLARSVKNAGQSYFDALSEAGIPVVMDHTQGFFDTREIQLMTNMLQVIDNPRQDMALAAVLAGPMFSFTEEELAVIRGGSRHQEESQKMDFYDSLIGYDKEDALSGKIRHFLEVLDRLRQKTSYATVAELIQDIYQETGIYETVRMMKEGAQRTANMDSLMEQAREFDETVYHGLYQFVRYINRIQEQQEEMGEVNIVGEEENVVRIMTIHKSKGLEFPICILAGMGKKLGSTNRSFLTIQPEIGIASKLVYNETRTARDTLYRRFLQRQNDLADLGEELRVLYVAMTRAKEKLILVGCRKEIEGGGDSFLERSRMKSFFDMVLPAALTESQWFTVTPVYREELLAEAAAEIVRENVEIESLYNFDTSIRYHEETHELLKFLEKNVEKTCEPLPVKVSVSDLKVKSMEELEMEDFTILSHQEEDEEMPVPAFMREEVFSDSVHRGAAYGTIWHQVMAQIDFQKTDTEEEIRQAVQELVKTGRLREEETEVLNYRRLHTFFHSSLGLAMRRAAASGRLHREQPFVMAKPVKEVFPEYDDPPGKGKSSESVLVQGIIDGYYEEGDGIVLMDYKTDSLKKGEEEVLISRYKTQMEIYKEALENMMDKPVKECILYSFSLGRELRIGG